MLAIGLTLIRKGQLPRQPPVLAIRKGQPPVLAIGLTLIRKGQPPVLAIGLTLIRKGQPPVLAIGLTLIRKGQLPGQPPVLAIGLTLIRKGQLPGQPSVLAIGLSLIRKGQQIANIMRRLQEPSSSFIKSSMQNTERKYVPLGETSMHWQSLSLLRKSSMSRKCSAIC